MRKEYDFSKGIRNPYAKRLQDRNAVPLPTPNKKETRQDFVSRCMGNDTMNQEYPDEKQRAAICYSQWRRKHKDADDTEG